MGAFGRIWKKPSTKVALLAGLNQMSPVVLLPYVTIAFGVRENSQFQIALSLAIIIQTLISLGVEYQIPAAKNRTLIRRLLKKSVYSAIIVSLLYGILIFSATFNSIDYIDVLLGGLAIALSSAFFSVANALNIRDQNHLALIASNAICAITIILGQVICGIFWDNVYGLVIPIMIGRLLGGFSSLLSLRQSTRTIDGEDSNVKPSGGAENTLWVLSFLVSTVALQLPVLIAGAAFESAQSAALAIALRIVSAPASLLGSGLAQGFMFDASERLRVSHKDFAQFVSSTQQRLTVISLTAGLALGILAPVTISLLFRDEWHAAGWMILVLAVPFTLQTVNRVLTPVFTMISSSGTLFTLQLCRIMALSIFMCVALMLQTGINGMVFAIAIVSILFQVSFSITLRRKVNHDEDFTD